MAQNCSDFNIFRELSGTISLIRVHGKIPTEKGWQTYCDLKRPFDEIGFELGDNAGIACGPASDCIVVDIDNVELFKSTRKAKQWEVPVTRIHRTGGGGFHIFFKYPHDGRDYGNKSVKALGFDIRGKGGQVVAPGSVHPDTGMPYAILKDMPMAPAPKWLLDLYDQPDTRKADGKAPQKDILHGVPEGERDELIFRYACRRSPRMRQRKRLSRPGNIPLIRNTKPNRRFSLIMSGRADCFIPLTARLSLGFQ